MKRIIIYGLILLNMTVSYSCQQEKTTTKTGNTHPELILRKSDISEIVNGIQKYHLLKSSFQNAKVIADKGIEGGIAVPVPKDAGGGYTHEKHKQNYLEMYNAGMVYQLTEDEKYAVFVRNMLLEYAKLYPTLGLHPERKNQAPGKLFWQGLNESVWLVYTIQAYDCIYDFLTVEERIQIEENLFQKMVYFFTIEDPYTFNRVHNHGTWVVAGVGMTGMVLGDPLMVQKALYSTKLDGSGGFIKQIDDLFSPDGYYAEGPYYQRYALMPFILFAQALQNNMPDLKIFNHKDGVLIKAVNTVLQLTNSNGDFYPVNDAIKDKSWKTPELIYGTNIIYTLTNNKDLLEVANIQGNVMLSVEGLKVAKSIANGESLNFSRKSVILRDGANGEKGGIALLRLGKNDNQSTVLFKFSSQGMGHGHFDRLEFLLYDKGQEIIPDYGSVRFLNVLAKEGGTYLPENKTWAKQTIAHNTLIINEQSDFNGKSDLAEEHSPQLVFSDLTHDSIKIVSATDSFCYKGAILNRTLALIEFEGRRYLIDLFNIINEKKSQYDLPVYFNGQIIDINFPYSRLKDYVILGKDNGYQHLRVDVRAKDLPNTASVTWLNGKGFYTMSALTISESEFFITQLGSNDPDFNLRDQSGLIFRQPDSKNAKLLSVYEIHGNYNPENETVMQSEGSVNRLQLISNDDEKVFIQLELKNDKKIQLLLDLKFLNSTSNEFQMEGKSVRWEGNYKLLIN